MSAGGGVRGEVGVKLISEDLARDFSTFVGQARIKGQIRERISLSKNSGDAMPHVLLCGPPEMGKAIFAQAIAGEAGVTAHDMSRPVERLDITGVLTHIRNRQIVVLEEIDLLKGNLVDAIVEALSDFAITILIGTGLGSKYHRLDVPRFTLVATTSKPWILPASLRRWFIALEFEPYSLHEIARIVTQLAEKDGLCIEEDAAAVLAAYCKGTPGNALTLIKRIRHHYGSLASSPIGADTAKHLLDLLGYSQPEGERVSLSDRLSLMSGAEFEQFVAGLFGSLGYSTEMTSPSGDHGVDILIRRAHQLGAVQCKRWTDPVGEPTIRDFLGSMKGVAADVGFVVCTSSFTRQAQAFAHAHGIELMDLDAVLRTASRVRQ